MLKFSNGRCLLFEILFDVSSFLFDVDSWGLASKIKIWVYENLLWSWFISNWTILRAVVTPVPDSKSNPIQIHQKGMWFLLMGKTNCVSNVPSVGLYNTRTGEIETDRMDGWSSAAVLHKTYSFSKGFPCFWTSIVRTLQQISANEKKTRLRKGQLFWGRNIFLQKAIMSFHSIVKCLSVPQNWSLNPIRHIQGLKRVCLCFTAPFPISKLLLLPSSYAHIKINFLIKLCIQGVPKQKKS